MRQINGLPKKRMLKKSETKALLFVKNKYLTILKLCVYTLYFPCIDLIYIIIIIII